MGDSEKRPDGLTHVDSRGHANMVDVGEKPATKRRALADAFVTMKAETAALVSSGEAKKGDVIATARIAGIMAAKRTADLIPLCHPLALTHVAIDIAAAETPGRTGVAIEATCETTGPTGVEMEALTAASVAALTIYDMLKAVDRGMTIEVGLRSKEGGASGVWTKEEQQ